MRPINRVIVVKLEDSPVFIQEFNKNKVSEEFLASCRKAGRLFHRTRDKTKAYCIQEDKEECTTSKHR